MKKIDEVEKQIQDLLNANNMKIDYELVFPMYKILPEEVRLAISVLKKHGMNIVFVLNEKKK